MVIAAMVKGPSPHPGPSPRPQQWAGCNSASPGRRQSSPSPPGRSKKICADGNKGLMMVNNDWSWLIMVYDDYWLVGFSPPRPEKYEWTSIGMMTDIPNINGKMKLMSTKPPTSWNIKISRILLLDLAKSWSFTNQNLEFHQPKFRFWPAKIGI